MNNKIPVIYWIALIASVIATAFITWAIYHKTKVQEIHFEGVEKQVLIQQAYKNKIAADSLDALLAKAKNKPAQIIKLPGKTDTVEVPKFIIVNPAETPKPGKDSANVIEGKEETIDLPVNGKSYSGIASVVVKPRYFPEQNFFASDVGIKKLDLNITQPDQPKFSIGLQLTTGIEIFTRKPGIMIGGGIQYRLEF